MKTTKDIIEKAEVVLKPGSCERLVATNKLTSYLKEFPKEDVISLLKDFTIKSLPLNKNLFIKKGDVNSISELQEFLQRRLVDLITVLENQSYQEYDEIKGWSTYLTRYPKVAFFIYNNFSNIFKLDEDKVWFYTSGSSIDNSNKLVVEDIKISTKKRSLKRCQKIAEKCGASTSEFENFIENLIDFLEGFILKNPISGHYRIREGNSREVLYDLIFEEIFNKFKMINNKLLLNVTNWKYLLYFDYQTGELSFVNVNHEKTISISLSNKKHKSSSFDKFDKLCVEFSNTIWNNDSRGFDKLLVDVLKSSIEDKVKELLMFDYTLDDVEFENVPLSLLTDDEIKSSLFDSSYKKKFDFSSMNKVMLKTKDPSQIDRMFALMREVVLEN
jgi:hypothetical protein